ncbi:hypothetical protein [Microtetraspora sp. NBRC 16547]|nr:hypothetical protein [Microtetraspora sp. NBRC 16547]
MLETGLLETGQARTGRTRRPAANHRCAPPYDLCLPGTVTAATIS